MWIERKKVCECRAECGRCTPRGWECIHSVHSQQYFFGYLKLQFEIVCLIFLNCALKNLIKIREVQVGFRI
jgi:hypothetical protein